MQSLNLNLINEILKKYPQKKEYLINALHELQNSHPHKYIDDTIMDACCNHFKLTKSQVYGVVTYYTMFNTKPQGLNVIYVCNSPICSNMGSENIYDFLKQKLKINNDNISIDGKFSLQKVECLGRCGKAPSIMINRDIFTGMTIEKIEEIISKY
ncbi:MAG: NAD(P)H-dependent oxidoreductase subunit E [Bacteroidales bacterium]|jgi:NADH:ubiquinone oxidoreductase subunit E|nr:NAD(P)H-dependent oxidoreductase subunit E [Bacteroidales bacterium]HOL98990.1 NAD(P)H-dependent oxidoreductase subunit E [Bacteroidales bacterium]HOM36814.1 NAD(P)H-dependent oxidoreductase subunit E [Bacteroidales bacterium]HPD24570.1 NAD(P)H-dependent oxidoreductase subunit E [Bacteroidales bacterium]HRS99193.1 NAD(P)H-dependent oxidoreductase subunit E [Bacteroidales bacterium]